MLTFEKSKNNEKLNEILNSIEKYTEKENVLELKTNTIFVGGINISLPEKEEFDEEEEKNIDETYFKSTPFEIHFKESSLFTPKFIELLKKNLGNPKDFKNKTNKEKKELYDKLQCLLETETNWKAISKKTAHQISVIKELFPEEMDVFCTKMNSFFITDKNKFKNKKYPISKLKIFYNNFIDFLLKENIPFFKTDSLKNNKSIFEVNVEALIEERMDFSKNNWSINDINVEDLIKENMDFSYIFSSIVKICMKKAVENVFTGSSEETKSYMDDFLEEPFLFVKRYEIMYSFQRVFVLQLTNMLINYLYDRELINITSDNINDVNYFLDVLIKDKHAYLNNQEWFEYSYDVSNLFLDFFVESGVVLSVENKKTESNDKNPVTIWGLPNKIKNSMEISEHIPRIIKPVNLKTNEDILKITTPLNNGVRDLKFSKIGFKALNISHSKKFKINVVYRHILEKIYNDVLFDLNLNNKQTSFITYKEYEDYINKFKNTNKKLNISCIQKYLLKRVRLFFKSNINVLSNEDDLPYYEMYKTISKICGISEVELKNHYMLHVFFRKLFSFRSQRQLLTSSLTLANILEDFPLYYSNKLDFRTRMYPWQYMISRTSGGLKHLLMDYKGYELTLEGLINLLTAYYVADEKMLNKLKNFITKKTLENDLKIDTLKDFYFKNEIDLLDLPVELSYFLMLKYYLNNFFLTNKNQKMHFNLEIDQNASGIVLMSLLLKNKALASKCNLLSKEKQDIYTYVSEKIKPYLLNKECKKLIFNNKKKEFFVITEETGKNVFDFLSNRKFSKYTLMCFCYNQKHKARLDYFVNEWKVYFSNSPNNYEYSILNKFSLEYGIFLDELFPNILKQLDALNNILLSVLSKTNPKIRTLDGCIITWDYYKTISKKRSYFNTSTQQHISYRINKIQTKTEETGNKIPVKSLEKHTIAFLPHVIHSIDAAIMRKFIVLMYEKTGYKINHLHDCVLIHPNYVDKFFEIVKEVYTSEDMLNLAKNLIFDPIKADLDDDTKKKIETYEKEFFETTDELVISKDTFEPRNMYFFEK